MKKGRRRPSIDLSSAKDRASSALLIFSYRSPDRFSIPFQLFQRLAHQRLAARVVTLQANQRFNQARGDLQVALVEIAGISARN